MQKEETVEKIEEKIDEAVETAEEVVRQPEIKMLARFGFYTKGFLFITIGVLAAMVAIGQHGGTLEDARGALARVAQLEFGRIILLIFVVGAVGYGAWNILRGLADVDNKGKTWKAIITRIAFAGIGFFYFGLAWTAWQIFVSARVVEESEEMQKTLAVFLLALPFGTLLTLLVGLITIGVGVYHCYSGFTGKYQEDFKLFKLSDNQLRFISILGVLSFTARALLFGLVGYFFVYAAISYNPDEVIGMDGALEVLANTYYGKSLLFVTAVGLICHGILSLYEARFRRLC